MTKFLCWIIILLTSFSELYAADKACRKLKGFCQDSNDYCSGEYVSGKCSGRSNRKCCLPTIGDDRCSSLGGSCNYPSTECETGYRIGLCEGPVDRRCCVPWSSSVCSDSETRLNHSVAEQQLTTDRIGIKSNGSCSDRSNKRCTSLDNIRCQSLDELIVLRKASGCPMAITGGTEAGHQERKYSHYNGYKLDIMRNKCISKYIQRTFPRVDNKGRFDDELYEDIARGVKYNLRSDHWDISFKWNSHYNN